MKIPIRNLYFLLLYAWDALEEADEADVGALGSLQPQELLTRVLCFATQRLIRRGLNRDYIEAREDSSVVRGRIDFPGTVKRALLARAQVHLAVEELSVDNQLNRLLKATLSRLVETDIALELRSEVAALVRALRGIDDVTVEPASFARVRLHRNNRSYALLLQICELVVRNLLPEEGGRRLRFVDFTRDEGEMRQVFQRFVTRFYQRKRAALGLPFKVHGEFPISWFDVIAHQGEGPGLPGMRADIVLRGSTTCLVIDTKFTPQPFREHYGKAQIQTSHLYQLFGYIHNLSLGQGQGCSVNGMLLYPTVEEDFWLRWSIQGHDVHVASVNLADHWQAIENRLLSFAIM